MRAASRTLWNEGWHKPLPADAQRPLGRGGQMRKRPVLRRKVEHARCVAAEDCDPFVVAEARCRHHCIDRTVLPRIRVIAAQHNLTDADLSGQVSQRFGAEDQRVEIELL